MASLTKSGKIRSSDSKGRLLHPVVSVDEAEFSTKRCAFTSSSSAMKDEVAELSCSITSQHRIKAESGWTQIDQKAKPRQPRQPWRCFAAGALSCCCLGWLYACRSLGSRRSSLMQDGRIKCRSVYLYGTCCMLVHVCTILKSCACIVQLYVKDLKDRDVTHVKALKHSGYSVDQREVRI